MARLLEYFGLKAKDTTEEVIQSQRDLALQTRRLADKVEDLVEAVMTNREDASGNPIQDMARGHYRRRDRRELG
jgi:hypothetical protein